MNKHPFSTQFVKQVFGKVAMTSLLTASFLFSPQTQASTFTVTTNADSGAGSLRDAINQANLSVGQDTITFNLPVGQLTIAPTSALPTVTDDSIIDGSTQPGFVGVPIVEISGVNAGVGVNGLEINNATHEVRSLVINNFNGYGISSINGFNHVLEGLFVGIDKTGTIAAPNGAGGIYMNDSNSSKIGGATAQSRNVISGNGAEGIQLYNVQSPTIQNSYIGTNAAGTAAVANQGPGIMIDGTSFTLSHHPRIGIAGVNGGNVISGNTQDGIVSQYSFAVEIYNNIIGLNATGNGVIPNNTDSNTFAGVNMQGTSAMFKIGDAVAGTGNLISGNLGNGVLLSSDTVERGLVSNNVIGTNTLYATGLGNAVNGVEIYNAYDILVGGIGPNTGNTISNNGKHGVTVEFGASGGGGSDPYNISILGNSMRNNTRLGINLENIAEDANYIDPNDTLDADTGPNQLQNSPLITTQTINTTDVTISGTLNSEANKAYRIELFATNPTFNEITDREGNEFLGYQQITTNPSGDATWAINVPLSYLGQTFSANATLFTEGTVASDSVDVRPLNVIGNDEYFNTSEFNSRNFTIPLSATISKTHNRPTGAALGQTIDYSVVANNTSPVALTGSTVTDILDSNLVYTPGSCAPSSGLATCSFNSGTNTITWNIPSINASSNVTLTFQATVSGSTPTNVTTINNTATLTAPSLTTQASSIGVGVNHVAPTVPSNNLTVIADKPQITAGENLTYDVTFTNNGSTPLTGVQVQTTLDPNLEFVSCTGGCSQSGQVLTWTAATMGLGQNITNQVVVRAKAGYTGSVTTVSSLTATELPIPKTQSVSTAVLGVVTTPPTPQQTLPRTGGDASSNSLKVTFMITLMLLSALAYSSFKSQRRKIPVEVVE